MKMEYHNLKFLYTKKFFLLKIWGILDISLTSKSGKTKTNKKKPIFIAFEIQVLSTLAIKSQGKFRIFKFALAMRQQK